MEIKFTVNGTPTREEQKLLDTVRSGIPVKIFGRTYLALHMEIENHFSPQLSGAIVGYSNTSTTYTLKLRSGKVVK